MMQSFHTAAGRKRSQDDRNGLKRLDQAIASYYQKHAAGKSINVLDIGDIFKAGRKAAIAGADVEQAIINAIAIYCR